MSTVKTAVSLDKHLYEEAEAAARAMNVTRSRFFALAVRKYLRELENRAIIAQINEAVGEGPDEEEQAYLKGMYRLYWETLEDEEW